ncbi:MAG: phosphate/phosphite/phosphonate ABC transporter substrate-binding protein [candidate division Zixibacteria bacterium]|nr:phosphate/phosphite/phosphonate ABC transporter substrate-binding protein [candidate division Zixibacteria bacterium]
MNIKKFFVIFIGFVLLTTMLMLPTTTFSQDPETLGVAVIPFEEVQLTAKKFRGVVKAIEEITGKKVEWFFPTSYASLIEAQRRGFIHIGYYGPRSYIQAHEASKGVIEAFCQPQWGEGPYRKKVPGYYSYLIVKTDSPYRASEDLKGKILALTDAASTSGDLVPKVQLGKRFGKKITEFFSKTFYAGGHDAAALSVLEGRADAAVVADVTMDWAVDAKRYSPTDFRIVWKSTLIPMDPFAWRNDLSPGLKEKLKKAFLYLNEADYGKEFLKSIRSDSIVLIEDSAYDPVREIYKEFKKWE